MDRFQATIDLVPKSHSASLESVNSLVHESYWTRIWFLPSGVNVYMESEN